MVKENILCGAPGNSSLMLGSVICVIVGAPAREVTRKQKDSLRFISALSIVPVKRSAHIDTHRVSADNNHTVYLQKNLLLYSIGSSLSR